MAIIPDFQIIEAKPWHCGQMMRMLRAEHRRALAAMGFAEAEAHRELRGLFDASAFRRVWLIDGKLAALGGVTGTSLAATGFIWLTLTQQALAFPVAIIKEAQRQIAEIMSVKRELATTVLGNDLAAQRLAIFLGFHVAHDGVGSPAVSRHGRHDLLRFIQSAPDHRVPVRSGHVIALGYHHEAA